MASPKFEDTSPIEELHPKFEETSDIPQEVPPGQLESLLRGGAMGATFGAAPLISGGIQAAAQKLTGSPEPISQLYKQTQGQSSKEFEAAQQANPLTYGAGELGGGIGSAVLTAGAAPEAATTLRGAAELGGLALGKEVGKRAAVGATTGATVGGLAGGFQSKGGLIGATPEEEQQLVKDIGHGIQSGASLGSVLSLVGSGLGVSANTLLDKMSGSQNVFLRNVADYIKKGAAGEKLTGEKALLEGQEGKTPLAQRDTSNSRELLDKISKADNELGQDVGNSLEKATEAGQTVNIEEPITVSAKAVDSYFDKNPAIALDPQARNNLRSLLFQKGEIKPLQAKSVIDEMDGILNQLKGDTSTIANATRQIVGGFRKDLSGALKDQIPEYAKTAERFENFRQMVPETILSGGTPSDLSSVYYGSLKNKEESLFDSIKNMLQGATKPGEAEKAETFSNLANNLKQLEQNEKANLAQGNIQDTVFDKMGSTAPDLINDIKSKADESVGRQTVFGAAPTPPGGKIVPTVARTLVGYGKGEVLNLANKLGSLGAKGASPAKLSSNVYDMTNEQLPIVINALKGVPGLDHLTTHLQKGLSDKNESIKNAALFSIMQNPKAREAIYNTLGTANE